MAMPQMITVDGNEAAASVAYRLSEVIAIYPITPSSPMGELSDEWAVQGRRNLWGTVPDVIEMQSEGGAAGAVHGALQAGALATTFTASQGLLLMIPNMYKIAGELTPFCMHVAARTLATHALSIFGDHSDVMACRADRLRDALLGLGAGGARPRLHRARGDARERACPFLHFFDGFRTSHEERKIAPLSRRRPARHDRRRRWSRRIAARALTPDHPVLRGTRRRTPTSFFQAREAANRLLRRVSGDRAARSMDRFAERDRPRLPAVRLRRASRGRARARDDGLGRRGRARDGRVADRARREGGRRSRCGCTARSRSTPSSPRCRAA